MDESLIERVALNSKKVAIRMIIIITIVKNADFSWDTKSTEIWWQRAKMNRRQTASRSVVGVYEMLVNVDFQKLSMDPNHMFPFIIPMHSANWCDPIRLDLLVY